MNWIKYRLLLTLNIVSVVLNKKIDRRNNMEAFIVNGNMARITDFPHAANLIIDCGAHDKMWTCGASVVNQKILITAAHCFEECARVNQDRKYDFEIMASLGHEAKTQARTRAKAKKFVLHKKYDSATCFADIALVEMFKNIKFSRYIKRVIIPRIYPTQYKTAKMAAWGTINEETGTLSSTLMSIEQKLRSADYCMQYLDDLDRDHLCAGSSKVRAFGAEGDSGSGLITPGYQMIGIVSYRSDANKGITAYTNVTYYYDWIMKITNKLYCS